MRKRLFEIICKNVLKVSTNFKKPQSVRRKEDLKRNWDQRIRITFLFLAIVGLSFSKIGQPKSDNFFPPEPYGI